MEDLSTNFMLLQGCMTIKAPVSREFGNQSDTDIIKGKLGVLQNTLSHAVGSTFKGITSWKSASER